MLLNKIIAHRGASALAPENTMPAFEKARALGANVLEFDVRLSVDNEAFIFHDATLERTTNGHGEFNRVTSDYLQTLDAGSWFKKSYQGAKIPLLQDVLAWLIATNLNANIELKPDAHNREVLTTQVLGLINQCWPTNKPLPVISSFDWEALELCRTLAPEMPMGLLMHDWLEEGVARAATLQCASIHLSKHIVNKKRIAAIKAQHFEVYVYTINSKFTAKRLFNIGIDGIFTNYPNLL